MAELEHAARADDVLRDALARGANVHVVTGSMVFTQEELLKAIARVMDFPDYFGGNLDALYDYLTDLSWLPRGAHVLLWTGPNMLAVTEPSGYESVRDVLAAAVDRMRDGQRTLSVILTDS